MNLGGQPSLQHVFFRAKCPCLGKSLCSTLFPLLYSLCATWRRGVQAVYRLSRIEYIRMVPLPLYSLVVQNCGAARGSLVTSCDIPLRQQLGS